MSRGAITISIDLELAWGNWDNLTDICVRQVEDNERPIIRQLVQLLDDYEIPVTWAFVAALLDRRSAQGRPGGENLWYAPDVIDTIRSARVAHDLGSHGGRHIYLDSVTKELAEQDLAFAKSVCQDNGIEVCSFVFPRNQVGRTELLKKYGLRVYRGNDRAWHQRIRNRTLLLGRAANLVDKLLPLSPETVEPEREGGLLNLRGSLLFSGRNGLRRFASPRTMAAKLRKGIDAASSSGRVFHLWFHPSNFWYDTPVQFELLRNFLRCTARDRERGVIEIKPMSAFV